MTFLDIVKLTVELHKLFPIQGTPHVIHVHQDNNMSIHRATCDYEHNKDHIDYIRLIQVFAESDKTAIYTKRGDKYTILVCADRTCWLRFLTTKEMCHIYLDQDKETHTKDVVELIGQIVSGQMRIDTQATKIDTEIPSEYLTILFAFELLMPYKFSYLLEDMKQTSYAIAEMFKIPEAIVDMYRASWYIALRKEAYSKLGV